ncbi:ABC transporter permease [Occultella kanbiaonis]|uniref:ABC transporter permease n=1 Tax=Occultella kanbiaonis TaxID=2675754 RepID=UPI0013D72B76|nr:ABC transporter permease [Occultella kanbiaonis]
MTTTEQQTDAFDPDVRRVPPRGGFNATMLGIELHRTLRNRRTIIFTLVFPAAMLFAFGGRSGWDESVGRGNVAAYVLISMAFYGAALTAAAAGAMVAVERAQGWSRQLRLTPLSPAAYILTKAILALTLGALAIVVVNIAGVAQGKASMEAGVWVASALLTLACTLVFAALGVFVGYLVPSENAMQILGPGLALFAFLGNVFIPITQGTLMWNIAAFTPMFGVAEVSRSVLTGDLPWYAVANAVVWLAIFVAGAAWRMSRDTARV